MSMTVKRRKDTRVPSVIMHKVADIRGGVSVSTAELGGDYLPQGAVLTAPIGGICHVVKFATVAAAAAATDTAIKVNKGHNLKIGDIVMADEGGKAYAITAINDSGSTTDELTLKTALGVELAAGAFLIEAAAKADADSALKYTPFAINGTGQPVVQNDNLITDAWVIAVTKGNALPDCIAKHLKGIINY